MADANSCQWIRSQWWLTEDQRGSVTRLQYVRLVIISEVVAVQASGNFGQNFLKTFARRCGTGIRP